MSRLAVSEREAAPSNSRRPACRAALASCNSKHPASSNSRAPSRPATAGTSRPATASAPKQRTTGWPCLNQRAFCEPSVTGTCSGASEVATAEPSVTGAGAGASATTRKATAGASAATAKATAGVSAATSKTTGGVSAATRKTTAGVSAATGRQQQQQASQQQPGKRPSGTTRPTQGQVQHFLNHPKAAEGAKPGLGTLGAATGGAAAALALKRLAQRGGGDAQRAGVDPALMDRSGIGDNRPGSECSGGPTNS